MRPFFQALALSAASLFVFAACADERETSSEKADPPPPEETASEGDGEDASENESEDSDDRLLDAPADDELGSVPEDRGLELGSALPEVTIRDVEGEQVDVHALAEGKAKLVMFYRGGWCPYCNAQVRELTTRYDEFETRGVVPVLISVDKADKAAATEAEYDVPFPLLSDPDLKAHEAFSVAFEMDSDEVEALKEKGMDLEASSGRDHHKIAMPSIFLFDADGKLLWQHIDPDYTVRPRVEQILSVLDEHDLGT